MAHSITVILHQPAKSFVAGNSTGFAIRGGVKYYDRDLKAECYTNYEAVIFASSNEQAQYYQNNLVKGAVVEVSGQNQRIKTFQGEKLNISIEILDARIGLIAQTAPREVNQNIAAARAPQNQGGTDDIPAGFFKSEEGAMQ